MEDARRMANAETTIRNKGSRWETFKKWMQKVGLSTPIHIDECVRFAAQLLQWEYLGSSVRVMVCSVIQELMRPEPCGASKVVGLNLRHVAACEEEIKRLCGKHEGTKAKPAHTETKVPKAQKFKGLTNFWEQIGCREDTLLAIKAGDYKRGPPSAKKATVNLWEDKVANVKGRQVTLRCNCKVAKELCALHCKGALKACDFPIKAATAREAAKVAETTTHGFRRKLAMLLRKYHEEVEPLPSQAVADYVGWEHGEKETKKSKAAKEKGVQAETIGTCTMWSEYTLDYNRIGFGKWKTNKISSVIAEVKSLAKKNAPLHRFPKEKKWVKEVIQTTNTQAKALAKGRNLAQPVQTRSKTVWKSVLEESEEEGSQGDLDEESDAVEEELEEGKQALEATPANRPLQRMGNEAQKALSLVQKRSSGSHEASSSGSTTQAENKPKRPCIWDEATKPRRQAGKTDEENRKEIMEMLKI